MKFLLVPLLIIGMFLSFTAAMLAMLVWTETVKSPDELKKIVTGERDATRLSDAFIDPEDKLSRLASIMENYRGQVEAELEVVRRQQDSLAQVSTALVARETELDRREQVLSALSDSARMKVMESNLTELATFYNKLKPTSAAEILTTGTLPDTTVAMLLRKLAPQHMAKILAAMDAPSAANFTKIMQEL
ncbi:MAG: hypothetical protein VX733_05320 [Candidatus Latescibacterota bacterium]|nr:hypothetical protein [Candidatus Latescibacterota bacterium]